MCGSYQSQRIICFSCISLRLRVWVITNKYCIGCVCKRRTAGGRPAGGVWEEDKLWKFRVGVLGASGGENKQSCWTWYVFLIKEGN